MHALLKSMNEEQKHIRSYQYTIELLHHFSHTSLRRGTSFRGSFLSRSGHEAAHDAPLHANLQALFGGRWAC